MLTMGVTLLLEEPTPQVFTSGSATLNEDQIAERGARMARRDDREYREYLREEQRSQPGCPAREVVLDQRGRATREGRLPGPAQRGSGRQHRAEPGRVRRWRASKSIRTIAAESNT